MEPNLVRTIGQRMKDQRKALQLTQEDVERLSGVPQATISRLESGKTDDLQVSTLRGLALALHLSADTLLDLPAPGGAAAAGPRARAQGTARRRA